MESIVPVWGHCGPGVACPVQLATCSAPNPSSVKQLCGSWVGPAARDASMNDPPYEPIHPTPSAPSLALSLSLGFAALLPPTV